MTEKKENQATKTGIDRRSRNKDNKRRGKENRKYHFLKNRIINDVEWNESIR